MVPDPEMPHTNSMSKRGDVHRLVCRFDSSCKPAGTALPTNPVGLVVLQCITSDEKAVAWLHTQGGHALLAKMQLLLRGYDDTGGRKPELGEQQVREMKALLRDSDIRAKDLARRYGVSGTILYKYVGVIMPRTLRNENAATT